MFRLTINGLATEQFISDRKHLKRVWMRVYRWGAQWGYFIPDVRWEESWRVERRLPAASGIEGTTTLLLERVLSNDTEIAAPPPIVDDSWEEQVVIDRNVMCSNSLSVLGVKAEIEEFCRKHSIVLPSSFCDAMPENKKLDNIVPIPQLQRAQVPLQPSGTRSGPWPGQSHQLSQRGRPYQSGHGLHHDRPRVLDGSQAHGHLQSQGRTYPRPLGQDSGHARPSGGYNGTDRQQRPMRRRDP